MKVKSYIMFGSILAIFIFLYYLLMHNIDYFIASYDNKILSFKNNITLDNQNDNIISMILGSNADIEVATPNDLEVLLNNEFMINMLSNIMEISKDEVKMALSKVAMEGNANIVKNLNNYDSDIIALSTLDNYVIIFSLDAKNIFINKLLSGESCFYTPNDNDLENVYKYINDFVSKNKILENYNFKITNIRFADGSEYDNKTGLVYFIEDNKNHIEMIYSLSCNEIYSLQIGFNA